jgi:CBS domain-containing protein
MPCRLAMLDSVVSLSSTITVAEGIDALQKNKVRSAPVTDPDGTYVGMFSLHAVFHSLLPVAVTMEDGLDQLDFVVGATPGIAKRLKKVSDRPITECLDQKLQVLEPETALWEGVRVMVRHGSPVAIVENKKLIGLMTEQSCLATLQAIQAEATSHPQGQLSADDIKLLKESGVL